MWYRVTNIDKANMWYNWKSKTTKGNITKMFYTKGFQGDKYFNLYILVPFFLSLCLGSLRTWQKNPDTTQLYFWGSLQRTYSSLNTISWLILNIFNQKRW